MANSVASNDTPSFGDEYFFIIGDACEVKKRYFAGFVFDRKHIERGNYFRTRPEAEKCANLMRQQNAMLRKECEQKTGETKPMMGIPDPTVKTMYSVQIGYGDKPVRVEKQTVNSYSSGYVSAMKAAKLLFDTEAEANARVEELEEAVRPKPRKPELNKVYHTVNSWGAVAVEVWRNTGVDNQRFEMGNCHASLADASEFSNALKEFGWNWQVERAKKAGV